MDPSGLGVALVTPFRPDDLTVDYQALDAIVDHIVDSGADYIVTLGTTAETPTLTDAERRDVSARVAARVAGRIPLVIGIGGNNTAAVVEELRTLDLTPFDAILSVAPCYNKPVPEGIRRHFMAIAEASPLPIILYNIPSRTGVNMPPDLTLRLAADSDKFIGVKEASGNLDQAAALIHANPRPASFAVLSGDDALARPMIERGARGVISVIGNALSSYMAPMVHAALGGDHSRAREIDAALAKIYPLLFCDGNPAGIKALLSRMGFCADTMRLPLVEARTETAEALHAAVKELVDNKQFATFAHA